MSRYETQLRSEQLADAYMRLARANHYMLGITETVTDDELDAAEQILIPIEYGETRKAKLARLALDMLDHDRKARRHLP